METDIAPLEKQAYFYSKLDDYMGWTIPTSKDITPDNFKMLRLARLMVHTNASSTCGMSDVWGHDHVSPKENWASQC